jgi:predicted nuclease with TOPRIM domain
MDIEEKAEDICRKLDEIGANAQKLADTNQQLIRDAVEYAGQIRVLDNRLNQIEGLARHALKANPSDLEETWARVLQIAETDHDTRH